MHSFERFVIGAAFATLSACGAGYPPAGAAPEPLTAASIDAAHARSSTDTAESLEQGRQLFVQHCNQCHQYADRAAFTEEQFRTIVPRMATKAHLSAADGELVLHFIIADKNRGASSGGEAPASSAPAESSASPAAQ